MMWQLFPTLRYQKCGNQMAYPNAKTPLKSSANFEKGVDITKKLSRIENGSITSELVLLRLIQCHQKHFKDCNQYNNLK